MESRVPDFDAPYYLVNYNNSMDKNEELSTITRLTKYTELLSKIIQEFLPDDYSTCIGHNEKHLSEVMARSFSYRTNPDIIKFIKYNFKITENLDNKYLNDKYEVDMEMNFYVLITATLGHDLFTNIDRVNHDRLAKDFIGETLYQVLVDQYHTRSITSESVTDIKKLLNRDKLHWILTEASYCAAEHRASNLNDPSTFLSYIFTLSDRDVMDADNIYNRALSISKKQVKLHTLEEMINIISLKSLKLLNENRLNNVDIKAIAKILNSDDVDYDILAHLRTKLHLIEKFSSDGYIFKNSRGRLYEYAMYKVYPKLYKSYFNKLKKLLKFDSKEKLSL